MASLPALLSCEERWVLGVTTEALDMPEAFEYRLLASSATLLEEAALRILLLLGHVACSGGLVGGGVGRILGLLGVVVVMHGRFGHGGGEDLLLLAEGDIILLGVLLVELLSHEVILHVLEAVDEGEL
eukprot:CAMPEP_0168616246 /NCGR_PEP_ID=MMETSP0449_2-20121227/4930_1 /TAXON_ID=1082188 /ORGANISM="Strombidium rassoulzadegani, Strain ras09" /LENGTH=127 /DNA_ID=CAMNT_0008657029 /DNA_START=259 /DNA_END=637 /DNA_ORIENTATION=+